MAITIKLTDAVKCGRNLRIFRRKIVIVISRFTVKMEAGNSSGNILRVDSDEGSSMFFRYVSKLIPDYMASHPKKKKKTVAFNADAHRMSRAVAYSHPNFLL